MRGGRGADTYLVDQAGDVVIEGAGGGADTILSYVSTADRRRTSSAWC